MPLAQLLVGLEELDMNDLSLKERLSLKRPGRVLDHRMRPRGTFVRTHAPTNPIRPRLLV